VDARVLLGIAMGDIDVDPKHQLVAPSIVRSQVVGLLLDAVRDGSLERGEAHTQLEQLAGIKVRLLNDRVSRRVSFDLAEQHGWDLADAEYVAVCRLQADALVTLDAMFAARVAGVVEVVPVTALEVGAGG
jgi:predicted nucleic acid-binding protein